MAEVTEIKLIKPWRMFAVGAKLSPMSGVAEQLIERGIAKQIMKKKKKRR